MESTLGAALQDLSTGQSSRLTKMGTKSEAFARQALIVARQNVAKLPTDMAADLTVVESDLAALDALRPLPTAEPPGRQPASLVRRENSSARKAKRATSQASELRLQGSKCCKQSKKPCKHG